VETKNGGERRTCRRKKLVGVMQNTGVVLLICLFMFSLLYSNKKTYAMEVVGSATLNSGENYARSMVTDGTYAYVGTDTNPAKVVKIKLSDLSRVGSVTLNSGEDNAYSMVTDGTYAYVGTWTNPAKVVKVRLSDLSRVGSVTLNSGENYALSMVTDGTYAYVGTWTNPAKVVKIKLSDLSRVGSVTLNSGEDDAYSMVTDGTYAYVGTGTSPAKVVKVFLGNPAEPPSAPTSLTVTAVSHNLVALQWNANTETDLQGYKIYRNSILITTVDKDATTYSDTAVVPGTTYTYQISAYNTSNLESAKSSPVTVTTLPATPTNLTGQVIGRQVTITWQGSGYPQYIIEQSTDGVNFTQVSQVAQTSYTETAPLWNTTYYYRVAQKAQDGTVSDFTEAIQVTTDPVPVPTGLSSNVSGRTVSLTWNAVTGINRYVVERSVDNQNWQTMGNPTSPSYTDTNTVFATRYYYRVRSDGGNDQLSEPSDVVQVRTDDVTAPSNLTATQSGDAVELAWSPAQDVNTYIIERSTDANTWSTLAEVQNINQYTDTNVQKNTDYYYRVRSNGITQVSEPSNVAHVRVIGIPDAVTGLTAEMSGKKITLTWTPQDYVQYLIARSTDGQQWQQVAEVNVPTFEDTATHYDTTYYYHVSAKNEAGTSEPAEVSATTPPVPVPTNVTATVRDNEIQIEWSGVTGVTGYRVERSLNGTTWQQATVTEQTSWKDTGLQWATTYYYRVRALDGNKESQPSATVTATTAEPPVPVTPRLSTAVDNTQISVSWNYQSIVAGYKLYVNGELVAELSGQATNFVYDGERGKTYTITLEAYNEFGTAQASRTVTVGRLQTPGASKMATDVLGTSVAIVGSMGSLVALGLALKGSGIVATILKLLLR